MDLILNELSVNGLSPDPIALRESVGRIMTMRNAAKTRAGVEVYCHRNVSNMAVASGEAFRERLQFLPRDEKRAVFSWLNKHGPFWEESQLHSAAEWYEANGEIVTETGLAEAAYCVENGIDRRTLSFVPSSWKHPLIPVTHQWENDSGASHLRDIPVLNYWDMAKLELALTEAEPKPKNWRDVEETARRRFTNLILIAGSFSDLSGRPFNHGVAERILILLNVLDRICGEGPDSSEGAKLLSDHFGHRRSWFSNSSESEINEFRNKLTFRVDGVNTLCPWHGKINNPPYRIHFTWPVSEGKIHVVYVGWKLTV